VGTTACSQNVVEGERIKLSLKREKTSQYVWPSTCFFFALESTFRFIGPFGPRAAFRKYVCSAASFSAWGKWKKMRQRAPKNFRFFLRLKVYKANKWL